MMKKMLVLALVLAVAGLSNAALVQLVDSSNAVVAIDGLTVDVTGNVVTMTATLPATGISLGVISPAAGILTPVALGAQFQTGGLGDTPAGLGLSESYNAGAIVGASASQFSGAGKTGALYSFTFSAPTKITFLNEEVYGLGNAEYSLGDGRVLSLAGLSIVPEPMTMALLGLGGLFLRKRK